jgi:hypothetical protein
MVHASVQLFTTTRNIIKIIKDYKIALNKLILTRGELRNYYTNNK